MKRFRLVVVLIVIFVLTLAAINPVSTFAQDTGLLKGTLTIGTSPDVVNINLYSKCVETSPGSGIYQVEMIGEVTNNSTGLVTATFEPVISTPTFPNTDPPNRTTANNIGVGSVGITARMGAGGQDYTGISASFTVSGQVNGSGTISPTFDAGCTPTAVSLSTTSTSQASPLPYITVGLFALLLAASGTLLAKRKTG
jgi:predicted small secreted protein